MEQAKKGDTVAVHYTGKLEDGTVFDSSAGRDPLEFTLGSGNVIPGFEEMVVGMSPGESRESRISAEQAYGPHIDEMTVEVDRSNVPPNIELEIGQRLQVTDQSGREVPVIVANLTDDKVILDANHPLAGKDLFFQVELVGIR